MEESMRIGLTRDFLTPDGKVGMGDIGLGVLEEAPGVSYEFFPEHFPEVKPEQLGNYEGVISLAPRYTRQTLSGPDVKLSVLARFGVGYDMLNLEALTEHDVIVTITPDGVRRPMASGVVTLLLALAHELLAKDRMVRDLKWSEKLNIKATGLTGRVIGSVGVGNIGREIFRLLEPFEMVHLAADPYVSAEEAKAANIRLVDLETLIRESDFVCVNCPLTPETRGLIGEREFAWMKPTAYFINTSRGPIVDQGALYRALKERRIRGAGLDVFAVEPVPNDEPLLKLDNVILTPHSLCWSDECFRSMGESAARAVLTVLRGEVPQNVVNRSVLERPGMRAKLEANRKKWQQLSEKRS
jgi:phosphoglycerate dehydrogenase-like enzyme